MDEYREEKNLYNFKIFSVLFELYIFGKRIEKSFEEPMLMEEYYFLNKDWLENLKKKFDFKNLENILNYHFPFDHNYKLDTDKGED